MADRAEAPTGFPDDHVPLESILCTDELSRRLSRAPDYEVEARSLVALAQALADSPRSVLQTLAETILDALRAGSAGISLLTTDETRFHWPAIAGAWRPHIGGGTPRDFGPCGDVLDRNAPQLFTHIERRYPYFLPVTPLVEECLLVPFHVAGKAVGTIWAVAHDTRRKFDAEDRRLLVSLGTFASSACQAVAYLDASEQRGEELRQRHGDLSQRVASLQSTNIGVRDSRRAALNLMEDAVQSRRKAETLNADLRESGRRFREMVDALPTAIYTTDADGRLTHFNPAAVELSGRTPELGTDQWCVSWKLYRTDGTPLPHDQCPMAIALKGGHAVRGAEIIVERPDGARVWCVPYPTPLRDATGRITGGINMLVDVTERRHAEERLRDSEQRFARFMHHLPGLAWIKDAEGRYVYANEAAQKVFQASQDEIYGRTDQEVFSPETAAQFTRNDRHAMRDGSSVQTIETLAHADGVVHHSIVNKFAIPGLDDSAGMVGGVAIDITELRQAEEALRASEERLQLSQQVAQVGTFDWNIETEVNIWTPELERMHGLPPGGFAGTPPAWESLIYADDRPEALRQMQLALQTGEPCEADWRVIWPDGTVRWLAARFQAFMDASGKPVRLAGVNLDITERKQHEQALSDSDRHKSEFLAMLAHELRNPLAPILASIEILRRVHGLGSDGLHQGRAAGTDDRMVGSGDLSRRVDHALDVLRRQVAQMVRLVDDLLDAGRISQGKIGLRKERVELSSVVYHAVEAVRPFFESRDQELTITLPDVPVYLNADATRLAQIVGNLLNNACKFSGLGGRVWLNAERREESGGAHDEGEAHGAAPQVAIRVRDTGIGIAADQLEHVFDMFTQVDSSLERSLSGLGIGLTLVKTLTEMHGGTVQANSAGIGQGTEFVVRLPIEMEAEIREHGTTEALPAAMTPLRILIVDDNRDSADMLAILLTSSGHETHLAHDGLAAVELAGRLQPDVILLDIGLPELNGYEAGRRIRRQQKDATRPLLVALTGWGQDEDRRKSEEAGFDAHLVKPVDDGVLRRLLAQCAARKQELR